MAVDLSMVGLKGDRHYHEMRQLEATSRNLQATASGQELENQQTASELAIQKEALSKLSSVAKGGRGSDGSNVLDYKGDDSKGAPLEQLGSLMIAGGAVKRGSEFLKAGVDIRKKEDEMLSSIETRNKNRLDNILTVGNLFSQTLGTARNQSEWEFGIKQMEANPGAIEIFGKDNFDAIRNMDYDPNVASFLNEKAMSAIDRAKLEISQQGAAREERSALDLANYRKTMAEINKGNLDARKHEQQYKEKTDGKGAATAPSEAEIKAAKTSVASLIFDGKVPGKDDPEYVAFESGAQDIASRAKVLVKENKGLDFNAAITRATIQSKTDGDWLAMTPKDERGFLSKMTGLNKPEEVPNAKFRGRGAKAIDAAPLPMNGAKIDTKALKVGSYYVTSEGTAKWDGQYMEYED